MCVLCKYGDVDMKLRVIIPIVISIFSIILTLYQILVSNRQKLFDKRIENYSIVSGLVKLYGDKVKS